MPSVQTGAFNMLLNRNRLPIPLLAAIHGVEVSNEINVPGMFSFQLNMVSPQGNWQGANLDTFQPGDQVTIQMGLEKLSTLIHGEISAIDPNFDSSYSVATISGFDVMARLRFGNATRIYKNRNENEIAADVASNVKVDIRTPGLPIALNDCVWQRQQSNYQFLLSRAELIDYELVVDNSTLVYRPSAAGLSPVKTLGFPRDLKSVKLRLRVPTEGSVVTVMGFDPATNKVITADSDPNRVRVRMGGSEAGYQFGDDFPSSAIHITDLTLDKVEALQARADAAYLQNLNGFIEGDADLLGDPALVAGVNIKLTGLSKRFDGIYYVLASKHSYDDSSGYHTSLTLRRTGA
ncbi:phage late control D family protein [Chitinimonas arctica]|uniref:Phage late control D family protein n=1 Tax=Chitinimonas arctica TaxID=2594795 RepID=A0A516SMI1_9NEIS|nr:phage late control D family protein [Chitinimonas arctica]